MAKAKSKHYVKNKDLLEAILISKSNLEALEEKADMDKELKQAEKWVKEGKYKKVELGLKTFYDDRKSRALTKDAQEMLWKIAKESIRRLRYKYPQDKEDCISSAMLDLLRYWDRFKPEKSTNAFAYYTQIAKKGFAKGWNHLHPIKQSDKVPISPGDGMYNI